MLHLQEEIAGHRADHREAAFLQHQGHHPFAFWRRLLNITP